MIKLIHINNSELMLDYLIKRRRSSYATRPSTRCIVQQSPTGVALGPGRYSLSKSFDSPSFEFSKSERFDNSDCLAKYFNLKKVTNEEKEKIHKRIEKNKETAMLSKEERQEIMKKIIEKRNIRTEVAKITRKHVNEVQIKKKVQKTYDKFRKFEYRMRMSVRFKQEIKEMKKTWMVLAAYVTITSSLKYQIILKKALRFRSHKHLKRFQFSVKFIGKMLRIHRHLKYFKGMRVTFTQIIRIYLTKYVKLWLKQRYKRHKKVLIATLESYLLCSSVRKMSMKFLANFQKIKSSMRAAMFYKVSLYQSLVIRWNKCEYEMKGERLPSPKRVRKALSIHSMKEDYGGEGCMGIPIEIKIIYLRKFIRQRVLDYLKEFKIFQTHFRSVHRQNKKNRWILGNDHLAEYPIPPPKVNIYQEFGQTIIKKIIISALNDKSLWRGILFSDQGRISKAFHKRISCLSP